MENEKKLKLTRFSFLKLIEDSVERTVGSEVESMKNQYNFINDHSDFYSLGGKIAGINKRANMRYKMQLVDYLYKKAGIDTKNISACDIERFMRHYDSIFGGSFSKTYLHEKYARRDMQGVSSGVEMLKIDDETVKVLSKKKKDFLGIIKAQVKLELAEFKRNKTV